MIDTFVWDQLPLQEDWPLFANLDSLSYPELLNSAGPLLDDAVAQGHGLKTVVFTDEQQWSYAELLEDANRIAHVLSEDFGLVSGNLLLLRGPNIYMMVASWFGVMKS